MNKKYVVRLSEEERSVCQGIIKTLTGSSQKFRRAQILLKADADGAGWSAVKIAEAFNCRVQTIEQLRKRLATEGFELALDGKKRQEAPTPCQFDGKAEAPRIAMRLGKPPAEYGHWTLPLLADDMVALEVVEAISHETVRKMLKNMAGQRAKSSTGSRRQRTTRSAWPAWKQCLQRLRKRTIRSLPCCVWTNTRFRSSRQLGDRSPQRTRMASVSITNTNAMARSAFSWLPNRSRVSGKRPCANGGRKPTGRSKSLRCWIRAIPRASM